MTAFPLDEGDTGESLLPDDAPGQVVQPLLDLINVHTAAEAHRLDAVADEVRRLQDFEELATEAIQRSGLPEHLADLKAKIAGLQLDLAAAEVAHAQTLLDTADAREALEWQVAYWEWGAKYGTRKRVWRSGWDHWGLELSGDEYGRRTLVIGPWVVALWGCRCVDCKADRAQLEAVIDGPEEDS